MTRQEYISVHESATDDHAVPGAPRPRSAKKRPSPRPPRGGRVRRIVLHRASLIAVLDLIVIGAVGLKAPHFLDWANFSTMIDNMALQAIVLVPTVFMLGAGRFDLSLDGVAALAGVIPGELIMRDHIGTWPALAVGVAVGAAVGLVNGVLVEKLRLNPLIVTLGTWWVCAGAALGVTKGNNASGFPQSFQDIGGLRVLGTLITSWYALPIVVIGALLLSFTRFGAHALATGGNREAARLNGIRVNRIGIALFVASAVAAALAGVFFAARLDSATVNPFNGLALQVIASAVIGGSSLYGGRGTVVGALCGLLMLNLINSATIYLGIDPYWNQAITGVVLLIAVCGEMAYERPSRLQILRLVSRRRAHADAA